MQERSITKIPFDDIVDVLASNRFDAIHQESGWDRDGDGVISLDESTKHLTYSKEQLQFQLPKPLEELWRVDRFFTQYQDPNFTPDSGSIGRITDVRDGDVKRQDQIVWKRAGEIFGGGFHVMRDTSEPAAIYQGALGDCYLVSALAMLACKPGAIERIFSNPVVQDCIPAHPHSLYGLRLCVDGWNREVVVDDFFPCLPNSRGQLEPCFLRVGAGKELWGPLIEKAYAKLRGGYAAICEGNEGSPLTKP